MQGSPNSRPGLRRARRRSWARKCGRILDTAGFGPVGFQSRPGVLSLTTKTQNADYPAGRTAARVEQERIYQAEVREWIRLPENRWCQVYLRLLGRRVRAIQCHHYQGRRGRLLRYQPFWIPVSWEGHRWIDDHRERTRELGLLCPMGKYNSAVQTAHDLPIR